MEITDLYTIPSSPSFFHMLESEEDFPFGAKTTSFLPPATVTNAATTTTTTAAATATYDLPEWMEGREILGLPNMFNTLPLSLPGSTAQGGSLFSLDEDDFCTTIKPEDMLVPLSELQPPHTPASPPLSLTPPATPPRVLTPPATPPLVPTPPVSPPLVPTPHAILPLIPTPHATLPLVPTVPVSPVSRVPAKPPIPKVIICRKITTSSPKTKPIQVNFQVMPVKQVAQVTPATPLLLHTTPHAPNLQTKQSYEGQVAVMPHGGSCGEHQVNTMALALPQNESSVQAPQTCDAEELINEMVQMIGSSSSSSSGFRGLENVSFDASAMEASMEDLLSQLEASEPQPNASFSLPSQDSTAVSVAAPHPSESHHPSSPASISVSLPAESPSSSVTSPHPSGSLSIASPAYLPSPVPSVGALSPAPSTSESLFCASADPVEMECLEEEWSPLEETHSYSRSQRKTKSSRRKSGARKTPYLEDRKERKKEQNKQAALRYRQKKKQEEDDLTGKIEIEEERQQKLKLKYSGIKQELSYLKKIMREVFMARGLLSEEALKKAALEKKSHK